MKKRVKTDVRGPIDSAVGRTGEKYITFEKKASYYRVAVPVHGIRTAKRSYYQKHVGRFRTLPEAIKARNKYLKENKIV